MMLRTSRALAIAAATLLLGGVALADDGDKAPPGQAADDLDGVARKDVDLRRPQLPLIEAQAGQDRVIDLQQRGAVKLDPLFVRKRVEQHPPRDLDPDRLVGSVVEKEIERRLVKEAGGEPAAAPEPGQ